MSLLDGAGTAAQIEIRRAIMPAKVDGQEWQISSGLVSMETGKWQVVLKVTQGRRSAEGSVWLDPETTDYSRVTSLAEALRNEVWAAGLSLSSDTDHVREESYAIANAIDTGACRPVPYPREGDTPSPAQCGACGRPVERVGSAPLDVWCDDARCAERGDV